MFWGGDIVWRYFVLFLVFVFDVGFVRGLVFRLYGFCFYLGLFYVYFIDRENIKIGVKYVLKKIIRD